MKETTVQKLPKVSAATIDRVLSKFKVKGERHGKRAALAALRSQIPYKEMLRHVESTGYLSADTVAHCGGDMGGDFVWTLTLVDEKTPYISWPFSPEGGRFDLCFLFYVKSEKKKIREWFGCILYPVCVEYTG